MQRDVEQEDTDRVELRQTFVIYRDSSSNNPPASPSTTASGHLEPRTHTLRSHGSADQGTPTEARSVAPRQNPQFWSGTSVEIIPPSADRRSGFSHRPPSSRYGQGRRHGFESGGGDNFASGASKKIFDPPTIWPVGGQNIA